MAKYDEVTLNVYDQDGPKLPEWQQQTIIVPLHEWVSKVREVDSMQAQVNFWRRKWAEANDALAEGRPRGGA